MPTISPLQTTVPGLKTDAASPLVGSEETSHTPSYTPLWMVGSGSNAKASELLGIRMPNASGDLSVLLAKVSLSLEQNIDESRKKRGFVHWANLASAMSSLKQQAIEAEKSATHTQKSVDIMRAALEDLQQKIKGPVEERDRLNTQIEAYHQQIEQLATALKDPSLTEEERATLESQLEAARNGLNQALADREAGDIGLANIRIANLGQQISGLEELLEDMDPNSDAAKQIRETVEALRNEATAAQAELAAARAELDALPPGPEKEALQARFSNQTAKAIDTLIEDLENRLSRGEVELNAFRTGAYFKLASNMHFRAHMKQEQLSIYDSIRDQAVEENFEEIAEEPVILDKRLLEESKKSDERQDLGIEDVERRRIQEAAAAFLSTLASFVSTLSEFAETPDFEVPVAPGAGNRLKLEI